MRRFPELALDPSTIYYLHKAKRSRDSLAMGRALETMEDATRGCRGLFKLTLAKILDIWGRPQGLMLMLAVWVVGIITMAACRDVTTYAAAQVFSLVG